MIHPAATSFAIGSPVGRSLLRGGYTSHVSDMIHVVKADAEP